MSDESLFADLIPTSNKLKLPAQTDAGGESMFADLLPPRSGKFSGVSTIIDSTAPLGGYAPGEIEALEAQAAALPAPATPLGETPATVVSNNPLIGLRNRAGDLAGSLVRGIANIGEQGGDYLEERIPISGIPVEELRSKNQLQPLFDLSDWLRKESTAYAPSTTLDQVKGAAMPGSGQGLGERVGNVGKFVGERVVTSLPDMAASVVALPAYVLGRTEEVAERRVQNDGRTGEPTLGDMATAAPAAAVEATLERFATKLLPGLGKVGGATAPGRIAAQTGIQSGTEAVQEGTANLGESLGTKRGVDLGELGNAMLEGGIVGGGLGGGMQGAQEALTASRPPALGDPAPRGETPNAPRPEPEVAPTSAITPQPFPEPATPTGNPVGPAAFFGPEILGDAIQNDRILRDPTLDAALGIEPEPAPVAEPAADPDKAYRRPAPEPDFEGAIAEAMASLDRGIAQASAPAAPSAPTAEPTRPSLPAQNPLPELGSDTTAPAVQVPPTQSAPALGGADLDTDALALRREIGWLERGGKLMREREEGDDDITNFAGRATGAVTGRTAWIAQPAPDGSESQFWRNRPDKNLSEKAAGLALDKYERGETLKPIEQRFIDHAKTVAASYNAAEAELVAETDAYEENTRVEAVRALREDRRLEIAEGEDQEALNVIEMGQRAAAAGLDEIDSTQASNESDRAYIARMWAIIKEAENDARNPQSDIRRSVPGAEGGQAAVAEGFALDAPAAPAPAQEVARPSAGLFGAPSARDFTDAAKRSRDAARNGQDGTGRTDMLAGDGELFAGKRPEQDALESVEADTLADSDLTPAERASFDRQRQSTDRVAQLRAEVDAALGPVAAKVNYLRSWRDLPEGRLRSGVEKNLQQRGGSGETSALFDPKTGEVYLFTDANRSTDVAVWNVLHEIAGHQGLRALLGDKLNRALQLALQNPTVESVAMAIALERGIDFSTQDGRMLAAEEALAELAAAVRTGNYAQIESRYAVKVPVSIRERLTAAIDNFLKRLKAMMDDIFSRHEFSDFDVRELLENAWQAAQGEGSGSPSIAARESAMAERRPDGNPGNAEPAADLLVSETFRLEGLGGLDVPSQREVLDGVGALADDLQVLRAVVRLLPVDVVDILAGENGSAEGALRDQSVLKKLLSADGDGSVAVAVQVADALVRAVAAVRAERAGANSRVPGGLGEQNSAAGAGVLDRFHGSNLQQIKDTGNSGAFDPANPSILENVEPATGAMPDTGRAIIADGRMLTFIDAAKAAGADLSAVKAAYVSGDAAAVAQAIDDVLLAMKPQRTTGTKNAVTDAERAAAGRNPILRDAVQSNEATLYEAMRTLKQDPAAGPEAVERLVRGGAEGVSMADEALLLVHKTELQNRRDAAEKKLADPSVSEEAKAVARREWEAVEGEIARLDEAAVNSGREWGRLGQFRQRMLREDFTLVALERKERARLGRALEAEESAMIKAMAATIAEMQARVDKLQERISNAASEMAYAELVKPPKSRPTLDYLRNAANDARARISAVESVPSKRRQSGAIMSPAVFYDYAVIGAYHIANGAAKFSDWVDAMRADLGASIDRLRDELPNIFKAAKKELDKPIPGAPTVAEVLGDIDRKNVTGKDVRQLAQAYIGEGVRGEPAIIGAAAKALGMTETETRALFVQAAPKPEQTLTEAQQELRDLRAIVRLENEIERLEAGVAKAAPAQRVAASDAVQAKRDELAALRQSLKPDPEARYQELRGKQIQKRIDVLRTRIEAGDFAPTPKRIPRALSQANAEALFELEKAKEEFLKHQFLESLKSRSRMGKVLGNIGDTLNLARAIMTSFDLSAVFRQGGIISFANPMRATTSIGPMLRAFASERGEHAIKTEIEGRPNARLYKKYGLELTSIGGGSLSKIEENYASRWLESVPWQLGGGLVRGSGRAYITFLNKLRADTFDSMVAAFAKGPELTQAEGEAIANFINVATGRGPIGGRENAGVVLNTTFFAPRLVASRFQFLAGQPMYGGSARTRKMVAREYVKFLIGVAVTMALVSYGLSDEDEEPYQMIGTDPRSSNFLRIKFGNTYLDPLAGLAQVMTLLGRLSTGETLSDTGKVSPLRPDYTLTDLRRAFGEDIPAHELDMDGGLGFGARSAAEVLFSFVRTKLAPVPGAVINTLSGSNMIGEKTTPAKTARDLVTPMSLQNLGEITEEQGAPKGVAMIMLGLLGMSLQHRDKPTSLVVTDTARTDIKERLAEFPVEQWASELEKMREEYGPILDGVTLAIYKSDGGKYGRIGEPRRTKEGAPVLETKRLSNPSRMHANYRKALVAQGLSASAIAADEERTAVHHIIPDNVVRQHPLMIVARTSMDYDLDRAGNLIGLTKERTKETDSGAELGHWSDHPAYDGKVVDELDAAMRRLRREHGLLEKAPKRDVLDAVRKVEETMRKKIDAKDVPKKGGRLAMLDGDPRPAA